MGAISKSEKKDRMKTVSSLDLNWNHIQSKEILFANFHKDLNYMCDLYFTMSDYGQMVNIKKIKPQQLLNRYI